MKCKICGADNPKNVKNCNFCGNKLNGKNSKKIVILIVVLVLLVPIIVIGSLFFFFFSLFSKYEKLDYIELGKDEIPTIGYVIGDKKISNFHVSTSGKEASYDFIYKSDSITSGDVDDYVGYLSTQGYYNMYNDDEYYLYRCIKESDDDGYVLLISIFITREVNDFYGGESVEVDYTKEKGVLSDYKYRLPLEVNMQEIGDKDYGYMQIPNDWIMYNDTYTSDSVQYISPNGKNLVTLNYGINEDKSLEEYVKYTVSLYRDDNYNCSYKKDTVSNNKGFLITAVDKNDTNNIFKIWIFEDEKEVIRYVSLATFENNTDIFKLIDFYSYR